MTYQVVLVYGVGDPETVAVITLERNASDMAAAIDGAKLIACARHGFEPAALLQLVVTKVEHGVAPNLLFQPGRPL